MIIDLLLYMLADLMSQSARRVEFHCEWCRPTWIPLRDVPEFVIFSEWFSAINMFL